MQLSEVLGNAQVARAPALIRDQVSNLLRTAILDMRLLPGELIMEREVMSATGASRPTVREALRQLQSEGLVISSKGIGTIVYRPTMAEAAEIYQVRSALEALAGRLFVEHASEDHIRDMWDAVAEIEKNLEDPSQMLRAKAVFYDVLVEGSGSSELRRVLGAVRARATLVRALTLRQEGRPARSLEEIKAIARAAEARDGEATARHCIEHIRRAAETFGLVLSLAPYLALKE